VVSCYVCDELNHQIQVFRVSMEHLSENLEVLGQLMDNCHIQVELFRGNNRIQKCLIAFKLWNICDNVWNRTFARKFGTRGSYEGQFNRPYGVSVVCDQLFVEYVNHRIQVFHCDGTFVRIFGSEESNEGQLAYIIESKCFTVAEHLSEIWMRFNGPFWALMFLLLISSSNK